MTSTFFHDQQRIVFDYHSMARLSSSFYLAVKAVSVPSLDHVHFYDWESLRLVTLHAPVLIGHLMQATAWLLANHSHTVPRHRDQDENALRSA
jgi:hypothetical protein